MNNKGFEFTMDGYIRYPTVNGEITSMYLGDYDENVTIENLEKDFDNMLKHCGKENDAKDRKALFAFIYYVILCCKEF